MRDDEEGRNSWRGDEEITNKKWKYEEGEVITWIRCVGIQYSSREIQKPTKINLEFMKKQ